MASKRKTPAAVTKRIERLAQITGELYQGKHFQITRLTTLKSLCEDLKAASHFVLYLARRTQEKMEKKPAYMSPKKWELHKQFVSEAICEMDAYLRYRSKRRREALRDLRHRMKELQSKYEYQRWGPVRVIDSSETLLVEKALECVLSPYSSALWGYHVAREYAERHDSRSAMGLIPKSAPMMADIVSFWCHYYGLELPASVRPQRRERRRAGERTRPRPKTTKARARKPASGA